MSNNKNSVLAFLTVSVLVAVVSSLVFSAVFAPKSEVKNPPYGAVSSPDIMSPYVSVGGQKLWAANYAPISATTSPCGTQSPNASSTLLTVGANFDQLIATSSTISANRYILTIATSTNQGASTTPLWQQFINSGKQFQIGFHSTTTLTNNNVLPPNTWVNITISGNDNAPTVGGSCSALFQQL